jgi:hypothetical protein
VAPGMEKASSQSVNHFIGKRKLPELIIEQHLYNGLKLGKGEIESVELWEKGNGDWDNAVEKAKERGWLVW